MQGLLKSAVANPWATLRQVLDGPLHPGGTDATETLLDRAGVTTDTRLLDVGCGAGEAVQVARARDAESFGVDRDPAGSAVTRATSIRGDLTALPVRAGSVDVVLGECVLCLVPDRQRALPEAGRVLGSGGRLALSDVVVEGDLPSLPEPSCGHCVSSAGGPGRSWSSRSKSPASRLRTSATTGTTCSRCETR